MKDGEFCVFLGPSGCGKSTAMHCIAGLLKPESGEVYINKEMVTGPGAFVPPQERNIAMVFQEYALYPNMTVRKNMSFALETRKAPKEEIARKVDEMAKMLGIEPLLDRSRCSFPAASASAWPSAAPWCATPTCFCSTNLWATWTPNCANRCAMS